ncbi:class I SAM-dependent methyltransferase [Aureivirga sp. CE67]|uniref:class I SAM-dependent methyltransferase n=1 Tax=Aureivirga sp. CE67 TaxID=1788983 RepID=UPI0018C9476E|nr:class I SAM-dependent methyltransferase [Aureivirga sp. CE67]
MKENPNDYNNFHQNYKSISENVSAVYAKQYSVFKYIEHLQNASVLDLACGNGNISRLCMQKEAKKTVGYDISEKMIQEAKETEKEHSLGCEFHVKNAADIGYLEDFDLVLAVYLLYYARNKEELLAFCKVIYNNLKKGGQFVAYTINPFSTKSEPKNTRKYGYRLFFEEPCLEGSTYRLDLYDNMNANDFSEAPISLRCIYFSPETYEWAFKEAGFSKIHWHPVEVDPVGIEKCPDGYWDYFLERQPSHIIVGYK